MEGCSALGAGRPVTGFVMDVVCVRLSMDLSHMGNFPIGLVHTRLYTLVYNDTIAPGLMSACLKRFNVWHHGMKC